MPPSDINNMVISTPAANVLGFAVGSQIEGRITSYGATEEAARRFAVQGVVIGRSYTPEEVEDIIRRAGYEGAIPKTGAEAGQRYIAGEQPRGYGVSEEGLIPPPQKEIIREEITERSRGFPTKAEQAVGMSLYDRDVREGTPIATLMSGGVRIRGISGRLYDIEPTIAGKPYSKLIIEQTKQEAKVQEQERQFAALKPEEKKLIKLIAPFTSVRLLTEAIGRFTGETTAKEYERAIAEEAVKGGERRAEIEKKPFIERGVARIARFAESPVGSIATLYPIGAGVAGTLGLSARMGAKLAAEKTLIAQTGAALGKANIVIAGGTGLAIIGTEAAGALSKPTSKEKIAGTALLGGEIASFAAGARLGGGMLGAAKPKIRILPEAKATPSLVPRKPISKKEYITKIGEETLISRKPTPELLKRFSIREGEKVMPAVETIRTRTEIVKQIPAKDIYDIASKGREVEGILPEGLPKGTRLKQFDITKPSGELVSRFALISPKKPKGIGIVKAEKLIEIREQSMKEQIILGTEDAFGAAGLERRISKITPLPKRRELMKFSTMIKGRPKPPSTISLGKERPERASLADLFKSIEQPEVRGLPRRETKETLSPRDIITAGDFLEAQKIKRKYYYIEEDAGGRTPTGLILENRPDRRIPEPSRDIGLEITRKVQIPERIKIVKPIDVPLVVSGIMPKNKTFSIPDIFPRLKPQERIISVPRDIYRTITIPVVTLRSIPKPKEPSFTMGRKLEMRPPYLPVSPKKPLLPFLPMLPPFSRLGGGAGERKKARLAALRTSYAPSLTSAVLGISFKKNPKAKKLQAKTFTGFEIRPLLKQPSPKTKKRGILSKLFR